MADELQALLRKLAQEKQALQKKQRKVVADERRLLEQFRAPLVPLGYRIVAGDGRSRVQTAGQRTTPLPKRLKCPRCDRRFSHRLHVARHMSATHGRK